MSSLLAQAQADGLCLHYSSENLGQHTNISLENAVNMLSRAVTMAQGNPFQWRYIDKPPEGYLALLFIPGQFPPDGIRYQEPDVVHTVNAGPGRELEVIESKSGFIPGSQDQNAWRLRRRYRLIRGGHPSLVLVHYTRGSAAPIIPALANQPVRNYPLRQVSEPGMYVLGEKQGMKQQPPQGAMQPQHPSHPAHAAIANQNQAMEQLERRRQREQQEKDRATRGVPHPPAAIGGRPHVEDQSDDETDMISTRTLALARYKRNHELMNEVFAQAAFGNVAHVAQKAPYSIFKKEDLEAKAARLRGEIEQLKQQRAAQRRSKQSEQDTS